MTVFDMELPARGRCFAVMKPGQNEYWAAAR